MRLFALLPLIGLAACAAPAPVAPTLPGPVVADTYVAPTSAVSRQAERTLRSIAATQYPGQDATVIGNCGILIANVQEIEVLANSGPAAPASQSLARAIFDRKEAQVCMTRNGIIL